MATVIMNKKPLMCKYCNQVEITFSKGRVSKAGKMIPLNVNSLEPHNCSQNPFNQNKQQQEPQNEAKPKVESSTTPDRLYWNIMVEKLTNIETKLDKVLEVKA